MKKLQHVALAILVFMIVAGPFGAEAQKKVSWKKVKVLVYTKNGKGFVHDNIPNAVKAIQKMGVENGFQVDVSDDAAVFTKANLDQYTFLLFPSTNNDVFDTDEQRVAFRRYIEAGGGFVGLHSVIGTERNWKWFKMMLGGTFVWHAKFQTLPLKVIDRDHLSVAGIPSEWRKEDECYFMKEIYPGIQVVMVHDLSAMKPNETDAEKIRTLAPNYSDYYPAVWSQDYDGGTIWITTLGHHKKDYEDPAYLAHILQGMKFVASKVGKLDYSKSYATERDTPLP
jgi:type 1 glutamine amidotransferase